MKLKQRWRNVPLWLKGGLIGVGICIALFFFYIFMYFPLVENDIGIPNNALILPMVTGHALPILSHFIVPYGFLCEDSVKHCTAWVSEAFVEDYEEGLLPQDALPKDYVCDPLVQEGVQGCCTTWTDSPTTTCSNISEGVGFFGSLILLLGIYFGIGAVVGRIIQKRKSKK
jgi:hypothetical protein